MISEKSIYIIVIIDSSYHIRILMFSKNLNLLLLYFSMSDEDPIGKEETTFYRDEGRKRTPRHPSSGTRGSISPQIRYDSLVMLHFRKILGK